MNNQKTRRKTKPPEERPVKISCFLPYELAERVRFEEYSEKKTKSAICSEALQEYFHRRDYVQEGA